MTGVEQFLAQRHVSRETLDRLQCLDLLLQKWNPAINLVSAQTLGQVWLRHFLDSAQVFDCADGHPDSWVDLGSGGGFPGLVVAILACEESPRMRISLVESDKRKAAFLLTAVRELGLSANVIADRIETIAPLNAEVVSARALAPLHVLLGFAHRHLASNGVALFAKGVHWQDEVALAEKTWSFSCEATKSVTDPLAVILKIKGLYRV